MTEVAQESAVPTHGISVVVWDTPTAIERGKPFKVRIGVKCEHQCRPDNWLVQVDDHDGNRLASGTLSDEPWPDTAALYYAEVELTAPDTEGLFSWQARAPLAELEGPHAHCQIDFNLRVVARPECVLTVEAIDRQSQIPVAGARVVVHPYRTVTDERGHAELRLPKGEYRLFVSGKNYFPFRSDKEVTEDMTIRAELSVDRELSIADLYA